jgi:hypothetical protein
MTWGVGSICRVTEDSAQQRGVLANGQRQHDRNESRPEHVVHARFIRNSRAIVDRVDGEPTLGILMSLLFS